MTGIDILQKLYFNIYKIKGIYKYFKKINIFHLLSFYVFIETFYYINYLMYVNKVKKKISICINNKDYQDYVFKSFKELTNTHKKDLITTCFYNKSLEKISDTDLKKFAYSSIYGNRKYSKLLNNTNENINNLLTKTKVDLQIKKNTVTKNDIFLTFSSAKITSFYKPIAYYFIVKIIFLIFNKKLLYYKYVLKQGRDIKYFIKKGTSEETILFFHGLGYGLYPYINILRKIPEKYTIICPIIPNISNTYFRNRNLIPEEIINEIKFILEDNDIDFFDVIGHNYGTIIITYLLKVDNLKKRIKKTILIDPVCFFQNFHINAFPAFYSFSKFLKKINSKNNILKLYNFYSYWFIWKDIYVQELIKRNFSGHTTWLTEKNIKTGMYVILSEKEEITNTNYIKKYLENNLKNIKIFIVERKKNTGCIDQSLKYLEIILKCLSS